MTDSRSSTEAGAARTPGQRAMEAYEGARASVTGAGRRAANNVADAPLVAIAGGIAAGALIAALLPRTDSEDRLIRPTARRMRHSVRAAAAAARETGTQRLGELGLSREKSEDTIRSLFGSISDAAKASARAAADAAKNAD